MKYKTLSGLAALTLFDIVSAHAQPAPLPAWTGFYLGVNAGYRTADFDTTASYAGLPVFSPNFFEGAFDGPAFPFPVTAFSLHPDGGVFGVHGGYNYQVAPHFLVGFEGDMTWGRASKTYSFSFSDATNGAFGTNSFTATIDWSASLRGRLGYVDGPWLFYGTGGISILHAKLAGTGGFTGGGEFDCSDGTTCLFATKSDWNFSSGKTFAGVVLGGGIEYLYASRWIFRLEYLFADYGRVRFANVPLSSSYSDNFDCGGGGCPLTVFSSASAVGAASATVTTQTVRFGLSYLLP